MLLINESPSGQGRAREAPSEKMWVEARRLTPDEENGTGYKQKARVPDESLDGIFPFVLPITIRYLSQCREEDGRWPPQGRPRSGFSGVTIERDGKGIHRSRTHRHDKMRRKSILGLEGTHRANLLWSAGTHMFSPHHAILISPIHSLGIAVPTVSPPTQPGSWMMRY